MSAFDVIAVDAGPFLALRINTDAAALWLADSLVGDNTWTQAGLTVEHRYGPALLAGLLEAGFAVSLDGAEIQLRERA